MTRRAGVWQRPEPCPGCKRISIICEEADYDVLFASNDYSLADLPLAQRFMTESVEQLRMEHRET